MLMYQPMYFHYRQPTAHSVDLRPIFLGPYGLIVVGAQILPMVFNSIPQKMEIHRVASVLLVVQVSEGVMIRHSPSPG